MKFFRIPIFIVTLAASELNQYLKSLQRDYLEFILVNLLAHDAGVLKIGSSRKPFRHLSVILRLDTFRNIYGKPKILEGRKYIKKSFRHSYCFSYAQMYCFSFVFYTFCIFFVEEEIRKRLSRNHLYCMKKSSSHLK